ncbi:MAG: GNAT family N-acetyltransferase [Clostridia bacterium]|nr:GNAT family N-acetyltransferase [Clostridia bacterium]
MEQIVENLRIRLLTPEDKERVHTFFRRLGEEGTHFFNRNCGNEKVAYAFLRGELPNHIFWAAVDDTPDGEEIAGIVFLWNKNTKIPWLGIGITEKWKGKHLGRRLMTTAKEWAESVHAGGIMLTTDQKNLRGQGLYEHMGYQRLGIHHDGEFLYLLALPNENVK